MPAELAGGALLPAAPGLAGGPGGLGGLSQHLPCSNQGVAALRALSEQGVPTRSSWAGGFWGPPASGLPFQAPSPCLSLC